ncbi:MAG: methyltransferase domain-containing protein [Micromonosporaceae bacterium]|nr:methyltransferase domain-containing protein [Micromonosporaceae bacterium]
MTTPLPRGLPLDRVSFDEQAAGVFDARAGFPAGVAEQIADTVVRYAGVDAGDLIVEIGAGTGLIGAWLARPPARYLGLDASQPMLSGFATRLPEGGHARLVHADADQPWPVADGTARVVFGSRVFQLLDPEHLVREANRVARPDRAVLVQGRLERHPDSPKVLLRRALHERLRAHGLTPRPAGRLLQRLLERAAEAGGTLLPPVTAASWPHEVKPGDVLDEWRQKYSMGGVTPPAEVSAAILDELAEWVADRFGEPAGPVWTEESFVLEGVQLQPPKERDE